MNDRYVPDADVLIIGGGPAGACAAIELARLAPHLRIMMVERSAWPRDKVCGCCLGAAGVAVLGQLDAGLLAQMPSVPVGTIVIHHEARSARLASSGGLVIDRKAMDPALVALAAQRGVEFRPRTAAAVLSRDDDVWRVRLSSGESATTITARVVLAADGLQGSSLDALPAYATTIAPDSRMGVSCTISPDAAVKPAVLRGEIHMHVHSHGYVGVTRLHDGALHVAAALDPAWMRERGGPALAMHSALDSCGVTIRGLALARCLGVGLLTRARRCVAGEGLFVIGDACGYVEPFTGEGMTWALASGQAAAQIVAQAFSEDLAGDAQAWVNAAGRWSAWHHGQIKQRQQVCSAVRWSLRRRSVMATAMAALRIGPVARTLAGPIVRSLARPYAPPRACALTNATIGGVA